MHQAYGNTALARLLWWVMLWLDGILLFGVVCAASASNNVVGPVFILCILALTGFSSIYALRRGLFFEWKLVRRWEAVCAGLGGNFQGEGISIGRSILEGVRSCGAYHVESQKKTIYPRLRQVHGTYEGWTAIITPLAGQKLADYNKHAEAFSLAYDVPYVTFEEAGNSLIRMRCGPVQVPETYEYEHKVVPIFDMHAVPMARNLNGEPWFMPVEGNHLLIAGRTGAGKSS